MKFYICEETQTVVEVVAGQAAPLTIDGKEMKELVPNSTDAAVEKHMPVLSVENGEVKTWTAERPHWFIDREIPIFRYWLYDHLRI